MGIATLGVLCVHSESIVVWPKVISKLFSYGGIGVYIFVFLSAIGLYYSLSSHEEKYKKSVFYKRRIQRVFIPYLMIAATWYGIKYLLIQHDVAWFFYELSTASFWIGHHGAWYVAMLVPVYIIFPFFYDWVEGIHGRKKISRTVKIAVVGLTASIVALTVCVVNPPLYQHLSQVILSIVVYIVGYYYADRVKTGRYNGYGVSILCVVVYIVKSITPIKNIAFFSSITWSLLAIPIITMSAWFLSKFQLRPINVILKFLGKHSLEMYLWNIFLLQAINYFGVVDWLRSYGDTSGYVVYVAVVIGGIILSIIYGKLTETIEQKMWVKQVDH